MVVFFSNILDIVSLAVTGGFGDGPQAPARHEGAKLSLQGFWAKAKVHEVYWIKKSSLFMHVEKTLIS